MHPSFVRCVVAGATIFVVTACGGDSDVLAPELTCQAPDIDFPATSAGSPVAFVNVNVITMNDGPVLIDQTVVVRGDRIVAVGPSADVTVSADAVQIDGRCRVLMPGLADMHVHLGYRADGTLLVANGVTTAREMWGFPGHLTFRDDIIAGDEFGPTLVVGSQGFRATDWLDAIVLNDPSEADSAGVSKRRSSRAASTCTPLAISNWSFHRAVRVQPIETVVFWINLIGAFAVREAKAIFEQGCDFNAVHV